MIDNNYILAIKHLHKYGPKYQKKFRINNQTFKRACIKCKSIKLEYYPDPVQIQDKIYHFGCMDCRKPMINYSAIRI